MGNARATAMVTPSRRAYTLIELILVIAVLGLAGALLVPRLVDLNTMEAQAAVRLIIGDLTFAQSDALAHQEYRRIQFFDDGTGYCIIRVNDANFSTPFDPDTADYINDPLAPAGTLGRYIVDFADDPRYAEVIIEEVELDGARDFLTFDALGGTVMSPNTPGTGGRIVVSSGAESYEIEISPFTGKLVVRKL